MIEIATESPSPIYFLKGAVRANNDYIVIKPINHITDVWQSKWNLLRGLHTGKYTAGTRHASAQNPKASSCIPLTHNY